MSASVHVNLCKCYFMWPVLARMFWTVLLTALGLATTAVSINRPVYKVLLTQKGYTQFLQYDLNVLAVREFTVCVWIRVHEFGNEQSVFTYVVDRSNRLVRLWIDSSGEQLTVSFGDQTTSVPVDLNDNLWRLLCLSYQSDFGAWALYIDSRLAICKVVQGFQKYVLPGGSVIFGYGSVLQPGNSKGLEGEIFGANMILTSTIERNTSRNNDSRQKDHGKRIMKWPASDKYIVLNDLQTDEINVVNETLYRTTIPPLNYKSFQSPESFNQHRATLRKNQLADINDKDIFQLLMDSNSESKRPNDNSKTGTENLENINPASLRVIPKRTNLPDMLSEFETPPSSNDTTNYYYQQVMPSSLSHLSKSAYKKLSDEFNKNLDKTNLRTNEKYADELSKVDVPPPITKDTKVYGQWTSSKYAGIVLDHIKRNKIPTTIPLVKISNKYPYPSTFKHNAMRQSAHLLRNTSPVINKKFDNGSPQIQDTHYRIKRAKTSPDINVKIIEDDIRSEIMKAHAETKPRHVRIIHRSEPHKKINKTKVTDLYYIKGPEEYLEDFLIEDTDDDSNGATENSLINIMPFLKSTEFYTEFYTENDANDNPDKTYTTTENDLYAKIIAKSNEWHNIKSNELHNIKTNNNTGILPQSISGDGDIPEKRVKTKKSHTSITLKYKPEINKIVNTKNEASIQEGILLAMGVSNQSNTDQKKLSLIKYNHGYLPGHTKKPKTGIVQQGENSFHKKVKIGNALNENKVLGYNKVIKRPGFYNEYKYIPDKQKSETHNEQNLEIMPTECKNIQLLDHILYAHEDGSIDLTHIVSPVTAINVGVEFIFQNYKKCSLVDSPLENHDLLVINWSKTPVRLFGGASPKKTKDLCGFF